MSAPDRAAPSGWVGMQCRPGKADGHLVFAYELRNAGPQPVLVMDAWRRQAPDGTPEADSGVAQVALRADGVAVVGKLAAAVPAGLRVVQPDLPLCAPLAPGESLRRELRLRLPFAERSTYLPELRLSGYEPAEVAGLILAVGWWPAAQPGLVAAPAPGAPGLHHVAPLGRLPPAGTALQRFPVTRLEILRRRDAFPRAFPSHPDLAG